MKNCNECKYLLTQKENLSLTAICDGTRTRKGRKITIKEGYPAILKWIKTPKWCPMLEG